LYEAKQVDITQLDKVVNEFGAHYRDEFNKGLELFITGAETNDSKKFLIGQLLLERKWGTWYETNFNKIKGNE